MRTIGSGSRVTSVLAAALLAATVLAAPVSASAAPKAQSAVPAQSLLLAQAAAAGGEAKAEEGLSDGVKQGIGCLGTATFFTGWALVAGGAETIMLTGGGVLAPSATTPLMLAFVSTLSAATCAIGAAATPAVLWAVEQSDAIGANLAWQAGAAARDVAALPGRLVAGLAGSDTVQLATAPAGQGR